MFWSYFTYDYFIPIFKSRHHRSPLNCNRIKQKKASTKCQQNSNTYYFCPAQNFILFFSILHRHQLSLLEKLLLMSLDNSLYLCISKAVIFLFLLKVIKQIIMLIINKQ